MNAGTRTLVIAGVILLAVLLLIAGSLLIANIFFRSPGGISRGNFPFNSYASNGEQIYRTGTSQSGPPVTFDMQSMGHMRAGRLACINCHGENGEGGQVSMMMAGNIEAPNIQYQTLTGGGHEGEHEEHEPYTEETLKRAITQGIDPAGEPLDWPMPRWHMTDEQLNDLIAYLKTLK